MRNEGVVVGLPIFQVNSRETERPLVDILLPPLIRAQPSSNISLFQREREEKGKERKGKGRKEEKKGESGKGGKENFCTERYLGKNLKGGLFFFLLTFT